MKTKRLLAILIFNGMSGLPIAALSQSDHPRGHAPQSATPSPENSGMGNMKMGPEITPSQNPQPAKGANHETMDQGAMSAMEHATPVGTLPQSDGSAGKPLAAYGIVNDMDDNPLISMLLLDQLEYIRGDSGDSVAWGGQWRIGRDLNRLWLRSEGERADGKTQGNAELLWGHAFAPFWDSMLGVRHDFGGGPSREWIGMGVQGLAPYKFHAEATAYLGEAGRTAARLRTEYDFLLTQRLIVAPDIEANFYGKNDPERGIGSGLSDAVFGIRLRYEIRREFAPYIGVEWERKFGNTANFARSDNEPVLDHRIVTGVRIWF